MRVKSVLAAVAIVTAACDGAAPSVAPVIQAHLARYPLAELPDLHMSLYHGAMGPGHGTLDSAAAATWLRGELAALPAGPLEPLAEDLAGDSSVVRVNLRSFVALGGSPDSLLAAFLRSGEAVEPRSAYLASALQELIALADSGKLPWSGDSVRAFVATVSGDHPTLSHSAAYLNAYRPAYRVLSRVELLRLLPDSLQRAMFETAAAPFPVGRFEDDYGSVHSITADSWRQDQYVQMQIRAVHPTGHYLIGTAIPKDSAAATSWSRIDWVPLEGTPWTWAYCIISYGQPSAALAEADSSAQAETPRTGCKGYPFTRMRALEAR